MLLLAQKAYATINVAVISDAILVKSNPYNVYYKTPDFMVQDVIDLLSKDRMLTVMPYSRARILIAKKGITANDMGYLRNMGQGYELNFIFLKNISKQLGISKIVILTSSIDLERDFLKSTLWNSLNISGFDVVNPTQRVSVYATLVDCNSESILWEGLYSKNIRNNKMKNLDTTVSGNYEGMMRLKRYSKFISPEISTGVRVALGSMTPKEQYQSDVKGIIRTANKKFQIGSSKDLNNPNATLDTIDGYKKNHDKLTAIKKAKREKLARERAFIKAKKKAEKERIKAQKVRIKEFEKLQKENNMFKVNSISPQKEEKKSNFLKMKKKEKASEWFAI